MSERHINHELPFGRPKDVLRSLESKAIDIRTILQQEKNSIGQRAGRDMDDAMRLAEGIEKMASKGPNLSAADANDYIEILEVMVEDLGSRLDRIFAS